MSAVISGIPALFQPPSGGDLVLRSKEGVEFCVHALFMGVASSVFNDMLAVGTKAESTLQLEEDAQTISLMLHYVYPTTPPAIPTFDQLEKALAAAQKYDLSRMKDALDQQLCSGLQDPLVKQDPLRAFVLCDTFGLKKARDINAQAVDTAVNLRTPTGIARLRHYFPESALPIRLLGVQSVRAAIVAEVLFYFQSYPLAGRESSPCLLEDLVCAECQPRHLEYYSGGGPIPWQAKWSKAVYHRVLQTDLSDPAAALGFLIDTPIRSLLGGVQLCPGCLVVLEGDNNYKRWARNVRDKLVQRLSETDMSVMC